MPSPALEEKAGPHPLENRLSGQPGLLILTALQTTDKKKPGRTREAEMEDDEDEMREKKKESMNTRLQGFFIIVIMIDITMQFMRFP